MPAKPSIDYGIDAPGVIAWLFFGGLAICLVPVALRPWVRIHGLYLWGGSWMATALLMLAYAKIGKFRHRDRILDLARLRGGETVLDVGTGRGLLAIGAAKRLAGGRAIGIDIFQKSDLSGNALERSLANVAAEGVGANCEIRHEDARTLASDFIATWQYAAFFRARGWRVTTRWFPFDTFPPLRIVLAEKPGPLQT